jgi:hypothetical protein
LKGDTSAAFQGQGKSVHDKQQFSVKIGTIFESLFKRQLKGTYISVEPFHLFRYLDEHISRVVRSKLSNSDSVFIQTPL